MRSPCGTALALLGTLWFGLCQGQAQDQPDKVLKLFQFPADKIPRIDGDASDWNMVPESYVIGTDQLHDDTGQHTAPDPRTLDVHVKVGWVKGLNRLYFLYQAYDNFWDFADPGLHNDTFEVVVDGDASGGPLNPRFRTNTSQSDSEGRASMYGVFAQNYHIFTPAEGKEWAMVLGCQHWIKQLPYANHAASYSFKPGQAGRYTLEFYITPFDYAGCEGPQRSTESKLFEGKKIGLSWAVIDYDGSAKSDGFWNLSSQHTMWGNASQLRVFELMPLEPQFRKAIEAKWSFEVLDPMRRLVAFQDESEGSITRWTWDFGDGSSSRQQFPQHVYAKAGDYVVVLTVNGPAGQSRLSKVWDVSFP